MNQPRPYTLIYDISPYLYIALANFFKAEGTRQYSFCTKDVKTLKLWIVKGMCPD